MSVQLKSGLSTTERARIAARGRWGAPIHVDLRTVDPAVARAIRALVAADEAARTEPDTAA